MSNCSRYTCQERTAEDISNSSLDGCQREVGIISAQILVSSSCSTLTTVTKLLLDSPIILTGCSQLYST